MLIKAAKPRVIECRFFSSESYNLEQTKRTVSKYELDCNLSGGRTIYVNGEKHEIAAGSVVFRRPGDVATSIGVYKMYVLTLDFGGTSVENFSRNLPYASEPYEDGGFFDSFPTYIEPSHSGDILDIYRGILLNFGRLGGEETCSRLAEKLIYLLASDAVTVDISEDRPSSVTDEIIEYISEHYSEPITLDTLSERVNLNKSYLTRLFKKKTGKPPIDYLIEKRLECAGGLLSDTELSVARISELCGFSDASYFIMRFKKGFGMTPLEYRRRLNQ